MNWCAILTQSPKLLPVPQTTDQPFWLLALIPSLLSCSSLSGEPAEIHYMQSIYITNPLCPQYFLRRWEKHNQVTAAVLLLTSSSLYPSVPYPSSAFLLFPFHTKNNLLWTWAGILIRHQTDFRLDFVVCVLMLYFFTHVKKTTKKKRSELLKTKYGQTIANGEGLHSDDRKGTLHPPWVWTRLHPRHAVRSSWRSLGRLCEVTQSPEFYLFAFFVALSRLDAATTSSVHSSISPELTICALHCYSIE